MLTINNTLDGYLKDVEIKGNTIQDSENLADIRSVGDTVEGQELYEIPIVSCGKNLFDLSKLSGGEFTTLNGKNVYKYIDNASFYFYNGKFKKDTQYTITMTMFRDVGYEVKGLNLEIVYTDGTNKNFSLTHGVIRTITSEKGKTIEKLSGSYNHGLNAYIDLDSICLNEGDVAINYQPYIEDKLTILSPVQLEKVGDVADRVVCKDGVWGVEKNITQYILNGTNCDIKKSDVNNFTNIVRFWISNIANPNMNIATYKSVICDKLKSYGSSNNGIDEEGIANSNGFDIHISKSKLESEDVNGINKYLKLNNLLLIYQTTQPQFIPLPHSQQIKLRTFTNKTNISFLTEIEGTIKAQVPKSIGSTVNTHTEQISNLNKELDRVKKLEESTVSTVNTESGFTTVEATTRGYFEDVKLEGKTLVNLMPNTTTISGASETQTTDTFWFSGDTINNNLFKPNTKYSVIFYNKHPKVVRAYFHLASQTTVDIIDNVAVFTTPSIIETTKSVIHFYTNENVTIDEVIQSNIKAIILEGDHTQNPPSYFEGLKSVGQSATTSEDGADEIVVSSVNENLIDSFYNVQSTQGAYASNCISMLSSKLIEGIEYTLTVNQNISGTVYYYGTSCGSISNGNLTFVLPQKTRLNDIYPLSIYKSSGDILIDKDTQIQLKIGKNNNVYTPHQSDKKRLLYYNNETQTWEKPILRQWDSIEKHANGKYYYHQRSAEVVLNGSENWNNDKNSSTMSPETYRQSIQFNAIDIPSASFNTKTSPNIISDLLPTVIFGDVYSYNHIGISISGTDSIGTHIIINNNFIDVTELKKWLQANNLTVVYQLAEEKVYECTNIDLITYNGETNFIVESGVLSPKTTLKVHNNISNVVSLLQKKVSLLESNMTKYMITQNRLQLSSTHSADSVTFKVDYTVCSENISQENYDTDLYNLILNNILVGKDNYNYDHMFNIIMDYASWSQISWDQFDILVGLMDIQHNPPIEEIPTDDEIVEEIPNEIM